MSKTDRYWNPERETMDPERRRTEVLERIRHQLHYVYEELPFYRKLYDEHGFEPGNVETLDDFTRNVPVVKKQMLVEDQAENPRFGSYLGDFDEGDLRRLHGSTGTSGTPTFYAVSKSDWDRAAEVSAMALWSIGTRPDDVVQISFPFSLFFGGWGVLQGVERLGATAFPLGVVASERQLKLMEKIESTVFSATPSYAIHLISVADELGIDLRANSVEKLFVGGEPGGSIPSTRERIETAWGAEVYDSGSTSEMYPFNTNTTCSARQGVHLYTDEVYTEIVDKDDPSRTVPEGDRGALVYTHLWRESQPMIRFYSADESFMTRDPCPCGRTYPRLPRGVLGRVDDMIVVRGANIYPSAIEEVLRGIDGIGSEFKVIVEREEALDEITVRAECEPKWNREESGKDREELARRTADALKTSLGIRFSVEIIDPGTLPETVMKADRVEDRRG